MEMSIYHVWEMYGRITTRPILVKASSISDAFRLGEAVIGRPCEAVRRICSVEEWEDMKK